MIKLSPLGIVSGIILAACCASAEVVINEIFYHAPDDIENLEWIELHNSSDQSADLSGWRLAKGIEFKFPAKTAIGPHGFAVICKEAKLFREFYDVPPMGEFKKSLNNSGDTIELYDAAGKRMDRVTFADRAPWPAGADGYGASIERIVPSADGGSPANWSSSPLPEDEHLPGGTPGRQNASYARSLPPVIGDIKVSPQYPTPGQSIKVAASVRPVEGLQTVELRYRIAKPGMVSEESVVPMVAADGTRFTADIPGQEANRIVRFQIRAVDQQGGERWTPARSDLRPAVSLFVQAQPPEMAQIPFAHIIHTDPADYEAAERLRKGTAQGGEDGFGGRQSEFDQISSLDLQSTWFELTMNQELSESAYSKLKEIFLAKAKEREAMIGDSSGAEDPRSERKRTASLVKKLHDDLKKEIQAVLSPKQWESFEAWAREQAKSGQPGPEQFLKMLMRVEGKWLALSTRFDLAPVQRMELRPIFRAAYQGRSEQLPRFEKLMREEGDFESLQAALGEVEKKMWRELTPNLSFRQKRFLRQWDQDHGSFIRPRVGEPPPMPARGRSSFVFIDLKTRQPQVFDFVHVTERNAGYKVRFHKDQPLNGMTAINVIFEYNDRFVLAEPLAFELYRRVGNAACLTDFARLWIDGNLIGYHLIFEQVNGSFLERNKVKAGGDLYKLIWYGRGIEGQHEKKTNPDTGYADLVQLIDALNRTKDNERWEVIRQRFNVDQVVNYFAVNTCLSHWDGFFNNYFTYYDKRGTGKWEMYPWDQDKTWGFHDGIRSGQVFTNMPITFGMEGDRPPGGGPARFNPGSWWRPGGYFSKPLLANPHFRSLFLKRTREILKKIYTKNVFFPVIDDIATRLGPEVPIRAKNLGQDPEKAVARFERNIQSLKEHLVNRREFLLQQDEIAKIGP